MNAMPPEPQHARAAAGHDTTIAAAWAILIGLGGIQITFNVADALRGASPSAVRILAGIAPPAAAVLLSHLASSRHAPDWFRWVVGGVMLISMAVSIGATIQITAPALHSLLREIGLGVALDAASLLALWFIMDRHSEKAAAATAVEQAAADVRQARAAAAEAIGKAVEAAAELARTREAVQAELSGVKAELETSLADARTELASATARADALNDALKMKRSSRANRTRSSPAKGRASSPANNGASSPSDGDASSPLPGDVDTQAEALKILADEPDINGSDLGLRLGKTKRYGQLLKARLAVTAPGPDQPSEPS